MDARVVRIEQKPVRRAADLDGLDRGERLRIEHRDRLAAGKAMPGFWIDGHTVSGHHRNLAGGFERVQIPYRDAAALSATGDIQTPGG